MVDLTTQVTSGFYGTLYQYQVSGTLYSNRVREVIGDRLDYYVDDLDILSETVHLLAGNVIKKPDFEGL